MSCYICVFDILFEDGFWWELSASKQLKHEYNNQLKTRGYVNEAFS